VSRRDEASTAAANRDPWWRAVAGKGPFPRLVVVQFVTGAADAAFTVSLAGSLFLSVSVDAARCRTDADLPKHKGLTGFIVDMRAPGVEIRPLRQMTGGASFNEVFFNEVRVRDDHRLGDLNQGWSVALTTLMNERASIGAGGGGGIAGGMTPRIIEMVRHFGLDTDPIVRNEVAALVSSLRVASYTNQRAMDKVKRGQLPGPELSIAKLSLTTNMRRMAEFVAGVLGPRIVADTGEWGTYAWSTFLLGVPGMRIAGGSDEVMRNIVGERVLGLPKDPGIDAVTPFRDLKVGTQKA
jgi:alkylation response protein AidB-like acyl-CoA dehydrogenase